jgi:hypothetical protein
MDHELNSDDEVLQEQIIGFSKKNKHATLNKSTFDNLIEFRLLENSIKEKNNKMT